jgi:uncharacterized protein YydD (DUF2326 family)
MLIKCLRSEPELFESIQFEHGLNIIMGERSDQSNKTNGVGKTFLLNFIDFCFLSDYKKNRISKIPTTVLDPSTSIFLDLDSNGNKITIKRTIKNEKHPTIYKNGQPHDLTSLEDARKYLANLLMDDDNSSSLREMLRIFKRVEKVGYKDITNPDGNPVGNKGLIPYLYLFGLDDRAYVDVLDKGEEIKKSSQYSSQLQKEIRSNNIDPKQAKANINDLKKQLEEMDRAIEALSQVPIYESISDDISRLDNEIREKNRLLIITKEEIKNIDKLPGFQDISTEEILMVYNDWKKTLGDLIVKEISEIQEFQRTINTYKKDILLSRRAKLLEEQSDIQMRLKILSDEYKKLTSVLDKTGSLQSLKVSFAEQQHKKTTYDRISFLCETYDKQNDLQAVLISERDQALVNFRINKQQKYELIKDFQNQILILHEYLYGNQKASFEIDVKAELKKDHVNFISFNLQIDDEGSARTEHEKILLFDLCLLFWDKAKNRHLRTLIHDGAFEGVNEEIKFQLLNWIAEHQAESSDFQYIITVNRDSIEYHERENKFTDDLDKFVRCNYTKDNRFLKTQFVLN